MAVINTKGLQVFLGKLGGTVAPIVKTGTDITSITNAAPAVVTLAAADTNIKAGDVVEVGQIGEPSLNGKLFVVSAITGGGTGFTLLGSDASAAAAPITTTATVALTIHKQGDEVSLCLSQLEVGADSVNQISVGTFCDRTAQIAGASTPGTVTLGGYADATDAALAEVLKADADGLVRPFRVVLPGAGNGYLVGRISIGAFSLGVPLEGAVSWTATGTQASKIRWVY